MNGQDVLKLMREQEYLLCIWTDRESSKANYWLQNPKLPAIKLDGNVADQILMSDIKLVSADGEMEAYAAK